jgi:class 3 adenylate cyclase
VDLRDLAFLTSRLAALYWGIRALELVPALFRLYAPIRLSSFKVSGDLAAFLVWIVAAIALWIFAGAAARFIFSGRGPRLYARISRDDFLYVLLVTLGLIAIVNGAAALAGLVVVGQLPLRLEHFPSAAYTPAGMAAGKILLGLVLMLSAPVLLKGLGWLGGKTAGNQRRSLSNTDDTTVSRLISELIASGGAAGLNRLNELALNLKAEAEGVAKRVVRNSIEAIMASVELRKPDFRVAAAADGTVTIVFSDMEGFSTMTERLGDKQAHAVIKAHNAIVRAAVKANGGQEVELQGDGFLLAFSHPAQALRCAKAIHQACAAHSARRGAEPIRVRIGLHSGTPIKEGERFFGITVILAARIASQAIGGETLVSSAVHELMAPDGEFDFDEGRDAVLKGLAGTHRMYGVRRYGPAPMAAARA